MKEKATIFRQAGMTRNENECRRCLAGLYHDASGPIAHFLTDSVIGEEKEHLRLWIKSLEKAWSLESVTSRAEEAQTYD
jgi:hypothetical protein